MSMTKDRPPADAWGEDEQSYWRSPRTVAAGVVLVCVAAATAWAFTTGGGGEQRASGPAGYGSACGLTGGSTAEPTTAPDVQWTNLDGSWLPVSTAHGPGRRPSTGPWSCYSNTPTGAVLAAWGIPARMNRANFATAVRQQTLPGPGQAALLKQGLGDIPPNGLPTPTGFKVNGQQGDTVTITLYGRERGANYRCASTVQWIGGDKGDWALRLAPDGTARTNCEQLTDAALRGADFVAWGPNS